MSTIRPSALPEHEVSRCVLGVLVGECLDHRRTSLTSRSREARRGRSTVLVGGNATTGQQSALGLPDHILRADHPRYLLACNCSRVTACTRAGGAWVVGNNGMV
ncbi:hypothetical protein [Amycolatopsis coloradensis]|uniref:hypothetical protein n=1 Tax=Amycolatopsis coloradensis TaxID=76021 RepID=UPI001178220F|nr:hypothetical protein [Amycolatopsis coloradensis]